MTRGGPLTRGEHMIVMALIAFITVMPWLGGK